MLDPASALGASSASVEELVLSSLSEPSWRQRTDEQDTHLINRIRAVFRKVKLMKEAVYPSMYWEKVLLRERVGSTSEAMVGMEGRFAVEIMGDLDGLRTVLQCEADLNLVEAVSGGVFCNMEAPSPVKKLTFAASLPQEYGDYSLERRARCAREWLREHRSCITSLFFDASNRLSCLPQELCSLPNLRAFTLKNQEDLGFLPRSFGELGAIAFLEITNCGLVALPSSIRSLQSLTRLRLIANLRLTSFPDFGPLTHLKAAHISMNGCRSPDSIGSLRAQRSLETGEPTGEYFVS